MVSPGRSNEGRDGEAAGEGWVEDCAAVGDGWLDEDVAVAGAFAAVLLSSACRPPREAEALLEAASRPPPGMDPGPVAARPTGVSGSKFTRWSNRSCNSASCGAAKNQVTM